MNILNDFKTSKKQEKLIAVFILIYYLLFFTAFFVPSWIFHYEIWNPIHPFWVGAIFCCALYFIFCSTIRLMTLIGTLSLPIPFAILLFDAQQFWAVMHHGMH